MSLWQLFVLWIRYMRSTLEERFWNKVDKSAGPDASWPWTASTRSGGYGQFRPASKQRPIGARRVALAAG
jgi:hypothetical protein